MISNAEFFAKLTVPALKARLSDFNAVGISKLRKAELVNMLTVLMDGAHTDAIAKQAESEPKRLVPARKGLTTPERLTVYMTPKHGGNKLTGKQWRRINKKIKKHFKQLEAV